MRCSERLPRRFRPGRQAGFTLIELLLTLVVMAVLLAVAVPSFVSLLQGQHGSDVTNQFAQDMAWAQGQALSGQSPVSISLAADGSWTTSVNGSTVAAHSLSASQLQADDPGVACSVTATGGKSLTCKSTLSFDSIGIVTGAPVGIVQYSNGRSVSTFQVFASGSIVANPSHAS